ncbi:alkyl hydroperoxide reductase subunit F [Marihabitans asiaticum]|uniref:Alkyl hydroperoxide reductase subunit F n=1 Tax=Marihabitans asiaticum TaxID=415218 RepID=A0A560WEC5_9MICO|nr:alkyl hydroperoxide reductase subunit F [Marihabitans asiaticum]TWD16017.1 alkyl hydroperoxide reductase subunit F [Marihabitans asiaticum]
MALDAALANQLRTLLDNLKKPVELIAAYDERPKSSELRELLTEIAGMHDLVSLREADGDEIGQRRPAFRIQRVGAPEVAVTFAGIPLGHEFSSLVLALLQVGGHPVKEDEATLAAARGITGEHHFTTYMSLTCQNCPTVVQALNALAVLNPGVTHTVVEGSLFQDEVERENVMAVPTMKLGEESFGSGRMELSEIIATLDERTGGSGAEVAAAALSDRAPYDVLVLGGGPAGASAAIYAARKGIRTGLVTERFGGQVNDTMAIENLVSIPHTDGPHLAADLERHVLEYEVDMIKGQSAAGITPAGDDGLVTVPLTSGATLRARSVIIATGASWRTMGVPGEDEYRNKGVTFCPHCDGPLFKGKRVAVIGGGNSGVEAAIDLAGIVGHVDVVEFLDEMRADEVLQRKLRSLDNVDIHLGRRTTEVAGDGAKVTGLVHEPRDGGEQVTTDVEGVFVQIGLLPRTDWLRESDIELSERGEIVVDERGATNLPGVFAAGDATITPYKQIVVALGGGSTAALSAFDHLIRTSAPEGADTTAETKVADGDPVESDPIDVPDVARV